MTELMGLYTAVLCILAGALCIGAAIYAAIRDRPRNDEVFHNKEEVWTPTRLRY